MNRTFISRLVEYSLRAGDMAEAKAWLIENAPKMGKQQKIEADGMVVAALERKYEVEAKPSERPEFSGWTFEKGSARTALYRARDILRGGSVFATQAHGTLTPTAEAKKIAKRCDNNKRRMVAIANALLALAAQ